MYDIVTHVDLHASVARVWAALTDFAAYRAWNPVIESIEGAPIEGSRLRVSLRSGALRQPSSGPLHALKSFAFRSWFALHGMRFVVRVTKLLPERELRWQGALPVPKMFQGEHYFQVIEQPDGGARFTQGERYAGLLEPAFRDVMEAVNRRAMTAVNQALKSYLAASA